MASRVDASFVIDNLEFLHKGGRCSAVAKIGAQAFFGCTALELVALPESVVELGSGAFGNCNPVAMATLKASISADMTYPEGVTIDHVFVVLDAE